MKTLYQLFESAGNRFTVEILHNGLIRAFDRVTKAATLYNSDGSFHAGFGGADADAAVKQFMQEKGLIKEPGFVKFNKSVKSNLEKKPKINPINPNDPRLGFSNN